MAYLYYTARQPKTGLKTQGIVLVAALLFLFALTLLAISIFETSILQTKMQRHFQNKAESFQQAETALLTAENTITYDQIKGEGGDTNFHYNFVIDPKKCANQHCYLVEANGISGQATTVLQSIFLLEFVKQPNGSSLLKKYRLSWREL